MKKKKRIRTTLTLKQLLEKSREHVQFYKNRNEHVEHELSDKNKRLDEYRALNEALRQDIKWLKSLVQNLVTGGKPDGLPR